MSLVEDVYRKIEEKFPDSTIHTDAQYVNTYVPGSGEHVLTCGTIIGPDDVVGYRYFHLRMASRGGRHWVDTKDDVTVSPWIAGALEDVRDLKHVVTDAAYAESRAVYYRSFGVNYLGRVFADPRVMVLLDNKKDKLHNPQDNVDVSNILATYPESSNPEVASWANLALVSAGNVDKLEEFLDYVTETNVVAYTTGAFAKLNYIGRDYGIVGTPRPDNQYGLEMREAAARLKPAISS